MYREKGVMNNLIIVSSSSTMLASRGLSFLKTSFCSNKNNQNIGLTKTKTLCKPRINRTTYSTRSSLQPPDVSALAQTARISLTPNEVEEFGPKIQQVINWFGQLQAVDLNNIEPAIRADSESSNLRDDIPEIFENRDAMIDSVPSFDKPYIKVPKVLNKE